VALMRWSLNATAALSDIPLRRIRPAPGPRRRLPCPALRQRCFDLAFLDIEHRIRRITLREDLVRSIFGDAPAAVRGGDKYLRVERNFFLFVCHGLCARQRSTHRKGPIATRCGHS
jgi:hypothetical protein